MKLTRLGFPGSSDGKESACSAGDLGLISRLERSPGGGNGKFRHYLIPKGCYSENTTDWVTYKQQNFLSQFWKVEKSKMFHSLSLLI